MYATEEEAHAALAELITRVADHLDGFTVTSDDHKVTLNGPADAVLVARLSGNPVGERVTVIPVLPVGIDSWLRTQTKSRITIAARLGPKAIAARITRDLLPSYQNVLATIAAKIAEIQRIKADRDHATAELAAVIPNSVVSTPRYSHDERRISAAWSTQHEGEARRSLTVEMEIDDTGTHIRIKHGDAALTARIADALANHYDRHHPEEPDRDDAASDSPPSDTETS